MGISTAISISDSRIESYSKAMLFANDSIDFDYSGKSTSTTYGNHKDFFDVSDNKYFSGIDNKLVEWLRKTGAEHSKLISAVIVQTSLVADTNAVVSSRLLLEKTRSSNLKSETSLLISSIQQGVSLIPSDHVRTLARRVVRTIEINNIDAEVWASKLVEDTSHFVD